MSPEQSGCIVTVTGAGLTTCYHGAPKPKETTGEMSKLENTSLGSTSPILETEGPLGCSGVLLDQGSGLVLCHGMVFFPFLLDMDLDLSKCRYLFRDKLAKDLQIHVHYVSNRITKSRNGPSTNCGVKDVKMYRTHHGIAPLSSFSQGHRNLEILSAELLMLVSCPEFHASFSKLFNKSNNWHFYNEEAEQERKMLLNDTVCLHWFAVLKIQDLCTSHAEKLCYVPAAGLTKGDVVFACGSPFSSFCPDIFMNTLSKGIVCNLDGKGNAMVLIDARCLPGTEGGGVFIQSADRCYLVGIIVAPLCWKANEWIGLTLVCSVAHIIENVKRALPGTGHSLRCFLPTMPASRTHSLITLGRHRLSQLISAVVLVECHQAWGSGVMLSSGLVLTCRHVINGVSSVTVRVTVAPERSHVMKGKVVFATVETSPYDIAVVELENGFPHIEGPTLATTFHTGEDLIVIGFGVFGHKCSPSVTSGILSAVNTVDEKPVMLQTTCAVHAGSSGGALFSAHSGEILGIVSSNTKDNTVGATYPHLNFSIPITVLQSPLATYLQTGDTSAFEVLNRVDEDVNAVWKLQMKPLGKSSSKL